MTSARNAPALEPLPAVAAAGRVSTGEPIRVGIIGAGNISRNHVEGYLDAGANVVAVADPNPLALETRAREWGVTRTFADYQELLDQPDIDAVSICAPNAVHHPATIAAAKAGKHVLCEKPISLSIAEADEMITACRDAGVVLQVNHHLRSNPAVQRTKSMLAPGELGRIAYVRFRQAHDWGGADTLRPTFQLRSLAGGGTLLDNGCHLFDLARYLAGPVDGGVLPRGDHQVRDRAGGHRGRQPAVRLRRPGRPRDGVDGDRLGGRVRDLRHPGEHRVQQSDRQEGASPPVPRPARPSWGDSAATSWEFAGGSDYTRHIVAFLAAIRREGDVICTGEDGREAVRLVLAAYQSADAGSPCASRAEHRLPQKERGGSR